MGGLSTIAQRRDIYLRTRQQASGGGGGTIGGATESTLDALRDRIVDAQTPEGNHRVELMSGDTPLLVEDEARVLVVNGPTDPIPVSLPPGAIEVRPAGGSAQDLLVANGQFSRPADTNAYAAGDLVANSAAAGTVAALTIEGVTRVAGEAVRFERARLISSNPAARNVPFRLHFFREPPVVTVGDNGAFNAAGALAVASIAGRIGGMAVTPNFAGANGAVGIGTPDTLPSISTVPLVDRRIYVLIEVLAAYAPLSGETFTVVIEGVRA